MDFNHFSLSDVGLVRKGNEDSYGSKMTVNGYIFVVCDGMGGHKGGATASSLAVEKILDYFEEPIQNIFVGISDALQFANSIVHQTSLSDEDLNGMGTTATVLVFKDEACYIGHVGDSRIYLYSDNKLNRLTKDHSYVQTLVDQGIINDEDAENHPQKNQILQALGIKPEVQPTVSEAPIMPKVGDTFILCSDGLNGMIGDKEIESLIDPSNLDASAHNLIDAAKNAGGKDNVTATLVAVTESEHATSVFVHYNPVSNNEGDGGSAMKTIIEDRMSTKTLNWKIITLITTSSILLFFLIYFIFIRDESKPSNSGTNAPSTTEEANASDEAKEKSTIPANRKSNDPGIQPINTVEPEENDNPLESSDLVHEVKSGETIVSLCNCNENPDSMNEFKVKLIALNPQYQDKLEKDKLEVGWKLKMPK